MSITALVIAGGAPLASSVRDNLPAHQLAIAADGGLDQAHSLDLRLDLVVGDLDSASPTSIEWARHSGVEFEQHDADKDATDLELAIEAAVARGADRLILIGGRGGRLDHMAAGLALVASERWSDVDIEWAGADGYLTVVRGQARLDSRRGPRVTLLAAGGPARGVTTGGLRWEMDGDRLEPGSTRGVSNEILGRQATVSVEQGTLLAIQS